MRMFVGGEWSSGRSIISVRSPYDNSEIDTVPNADSHDVARALTSAERGAAAMRMLTALERSAILLRAARRVEEQRENLARTITLEAGKTLREARTEVGRAAETLTLSAEEAKRLGGETLPLDAAPGGVGKLGFTLRVPCGVVLAISPFNFPLNLVAHKVGPALAAGNAVVLKPASATPLSALKLVEILLEAGAPPESLQCLTGSGGLVGPMLCADPRIRKVTFTGSREVGEAICKVAGIKKVTMELGSNSPLIVMPDANLDTVATVAAASGYACAGQVCISTQRLLVARSVYADFLDAMTPKVKSIVSGDPLGENVQMGPMIKESESKRVYDWIHEAVEGGARLLAGGERNGTMLAPTLLAEVDLSMRVSREELFGPAVTVTPFSDIEQAIAFANNTRFGLAAGIFTQNIQWATAFIRHVHAGNLMVNWAPNWRVDLMPYGGLKDSGLGKEGPHYAVQEMTELKTVVIH